MNRGPRTWDLPTGRTNYAADPQDWQTDYRCPDIAVFLDENKDAKRQEAFYTGAADFFVEVASADDRVRDRLPFYGKLHVQELLIIDRNPWQPELLRYADGKLAPAATGTVVGGEVLESRRLAVTFQLVPRGKRPGIRVVYSKTNQEWVV